MSHSHAHEKQGLLSPYLAAQRYKQARKFLKNNDILLDIGCGSGELKKYLSPRIKYFGIDTEEQWEGDSSYLFKVKSSSILPSAIRKQKFNSVTALAVIEHLKRPKELFDTTSKILPNGGLFVLTTPHPIGRTIHDLGAKIGLFSSHASEEHETFLNKKDLLSLGREAGFEVICYSRFLFGMNQLAVYKKK